MNQSQLGDIHLKLDLIMGSVSKTREELIETNGDIKAIKEHLNTLNGKVLKNMNEIEKARCDVVELNNKYTFARGSIYGLTIITGLLGFVLLLKNFGFW